MMAIIRSVVASPWPFLGSFVSFPMSGTEPKTVRSLWSGGWVRTPSSVESAGDWGSSVGFCWEGPTRM